MRQLRSWHLSTLKVLSESMSALARTSERDCRTRTTGENCTASESWTRTKYGYDSFGKQSSSSGSVTNPFQYTAREFDSEASLYYYRARYYDQNSGRFLNEDVIRFGGGENFYAYTNNSPVTFGDPMGLAPCSASGVAGCEADCAAKGMTYGSCTHVDINFGVARLQFDVCACQGPCGDCTPLQQALMQGAVNAACKSGPSACKASQTCAQLKANLAINAACATARNRINNTCYRGGDPGHKQAAADAAGAAAKCAGFVAAKGCK